MRFINLLKKFGKGFKSHPDSPSTAWNFFSKIVKVILLVLAVVILFLAGLILTVSKDFLKQVIKKELQQSAGLTFSEDEFRKLFPIGVEWRHISIMREGFKNPVLTLDKLQARLDILYLFKGGARIVVNVYKGAGSLRGDVVLKGENTTVSLWADAMEFKAVPYLDSFDLGRNAGLSGRIKMTFQRGKCPCGTVDVGGRDMDGRGLKISGLPVSFGQGLKATISAELKDDCKIYIKGLWLEGENLAANVHGYIFLASQYTKSPIDLDIEIMPRTSFVAGGNNLLSLLTNYRKSFNYYLVKIRGTIESPILSK